MNSLFNMSDRMYNFLKELITIWVPAFIVMWSAISHIWGIPYESQIIGTIAAINTFVGACLKISTKNYNNRINKT